MALAEPCIGNRPGVATLPGVAPERVAGVAAASVATGCASMMRSTAFTSLLRLCANVLMRDAV